jgi:hypothetical protein
LYSTLQGDVWTAAAAAGEIQCCGGAGNADGSGDSLNLAMAKNSSDDPVLVGLVVVGTPTGEHGMDRDLACAALLTPFVVEVKVISVVRQDSLHELMET